MITERTALLIEKTLAVAQEATDRYSHFLEGRQWGPIDEIALNVETQPELIALAQCLKDLGWAQFNRARDNVRTSPIPSRYEVEYHFFEHLDKPWRLEVMKMTSGYSPLHGALARPVGGALCVPVHASFKVPDEERYAYAREDLSEMGLFEAQRCDSTYGRFSYWTNLDQSEKVPYLKPRVNLRDA